MKKLMLDNRPARCTIVCLFVSLAAAQPAMMDAEDWPHWRGAQRSGVTTESSGWSGSRWVDFNPTWTASAGEGASSPLVVGSAIYTFGFQSDHEILSCLDSGTGTTVWSTKYLAKRYGRNATGDEGLYSGPSSTPEYDSETKLLFTLGSDGDLIAWDTAQRGRRVWSRNLYDDYRMPRRPKVGRSGQRDYGYTSSPLIHQNWLLVEVGGPQGTIIAFEKLTGREAWRSQATDIAGHTGGMAPIQVEGVPCVAALTFSGLLVVRLDATNVGQTVATYPWVTDFANNIASPAVHENCVLISSEYNHQAMCKLRITLRGAEKLWEQPYSSKACTPVIHRDQIFVAWNRLRCLDWKTGKLRWEGPSVGDAGSCVVTSDEKLIVWAKQGDLFLVDLAASSNSAYRELARVGRLADSDVWPHVVVANQQVVCRDRVGHLLRFVISTTP